MTFVTTDGYDSLIRAISDRLANVERTRTISYAHSIVVAEYARSESNDVSKNEIIQTILLFLCVCFFYHLLK
jgi:hypothetical protein